jgi:small subunit ribosomal protein S20
LRLHASPITIAAFVSGIDMANTKGARKAARQAEKRRKHNASLRSALSSAVKSVTRAIQAGDKAAARKTFSEASSVIDRIADKSHLAARLRAMPG